MKTILYNNKENITIGESFRKELNDLIKGQKTSMTMFLAKISINSSVFADGRYRYERWCRFRGIDNDGETIMINVDYYKRICEAANIDVEKHLVGKSKGNNVNKPFKTEEETNTVGKVDVDTKSLEMAINKLGNIQMQNMEYLKNIEKLLREVLKDGNK